MFLKQENPEMDDFKRKKNFGSKGKICMQKNFDILRKYCEYWNI